MHRNRNAAFTLIELLVVIAVIAILAAILFPVFAQARDKARQANCYSNLHQIGSALQMYVQDFDEHLPDCCSWGRGATWFLGTDLTGRCSQAGITRATPVDTYLGPVQNPPRYIQELLHPYVRNDQIWFCPSVGTDSRIFGDRTEPTSGYNGTTYPWNWYADPTRSTDDNPFRNRGQVMISGLAVAGIPKPAEAPVLWDAPWANPVKEPCTQSGLKPAHANGLNVLYADTHAKFSPFTGRATPKASPCLEDWSYEHSWQGFYE